jgi:monoterpene epsilon-lactone hydrolase
MKDLIQKPVVGILMAGVLALSACVHSQPKNEEPAGDNAQTFLVGRTLSLPAKSLNLVSSEAKESLLHVEDSGSERVTLCGAIRGAERADLPKIRECQRQHFLKNDPQYRHHKSRYEVRVKVENFDGVLTEVYTPTEGVSSKNAHRVLINLHGGGFMVGSRTTSHLESLPIAGQGKIKVVSVDYRMAPEHQFPAASEDVVTVYQALLKDYRPESIGIYGCSAGGLLTAQAVALLQHKKIPLPGAVGMFCAGAHFYAMGTSPPMMEDESIMNLMFENPYFKGIALDHPLAFPWNDEAAMEKFPPSLLISSTNDMALSTVASTHAKLIKLGVEADLHVWEGLLHAFIFDAALPESQEAYDVIVKFFDLHLAE